MPENAEKTLMRKNNKNKLFSYSGNKEWLVDYINYKLNNNSKQFESYYELFLGSGSIFLNLNRNFDNYILNDKDSYIYFIWNAVKSFSYTDYQHVLSKIKDKFGDIKTNKQSYYNFRNWWNKEYYNTNNLIGGLYLLVLSSSCINSMLRFGPNGMNQSYGNREYVISEQQWNDIKHRLNNAMISNNDFLAFNPNNIKNSVLFLDPPYVNREMTYNKNGFSINNFINWITELNDNNLILYTNFENSVSDNLVNFGFKKIKLRTMISTSPNRKSGVEETGNEILYIK